MEWLRQNWEFVFAMLGVAWAAVKYALWLKADIELTRQSLQASISQLEDRFAMFRSETEHRLSRLEQTFERLDSRLDAMTERLAASLAELQSSLKMLDCVRKVAACDPDKERDKR